MLHLPVVHVGAWSLDTASGVLSADGRDRVALRPKTAAVLECLARHGGEVVSRDVLLEQVWPGLNVTDDSITQCVAEIRRALGEDGRLLRTVPRRGYVLDAGPIPDPMPAAPPVPAADGPMQPPTPRARLARWLPTALAGLALALAASGVVLSVQALRRVESVPILPRAPATDRARSEARLEEGYTLLARRDIRREERYPEVRALFAEAVAADPEHAEARLGAVIGIANIVLSNLSEARAADIAEARRHATATARLAPGSGLAWTAQAWIARMEGRLQDALDAFRHAAAADPGNLVPTAEIGWLLVLMGRSAEALVPLEAAMASVGVEHRTALTWALYRGVARLHAGDPLAAAGAFRRVLSRTTGDLALMPRDHVLLHLAAALALAGQADRARPLIAELRQRRPELGPSSLRAAALNDSPDYLREREVLFEGLALVGFGQPTPDTAPPPPAPWRAGP